MRADAIGRAPACDEALETSGAPVRSAIKVDLRPAGAGWQVEIEREGRRYDIGGLDELIRHLEWLATSGRQPARGLR